MPFPIHLPTTPRAEGMQEDIKHVGQRHNSGIRPRGPWYFEGFTSHQCKLPQMLHGLTVKTAPKAERVADNE